MISRKAKYAFKALFVLAEGAGRDALSIEAVAGEAGIPRRFLEHILLDLKRGGLVLSRRGRSGGYSLARPPEAITLGAVLRTIDGPIAPLSCISRTAYRRCRDCSEESTCSVRRAFAQAYAATLKAMDETTLADGLAENRRKPSFPAASAATLEPISAL
ncbi:MAG: Rrf2 family transcriptional regulator [Bauldia sp.]